MNEARILVAVKEVAVALIPISMLRTEVMGARQQHLEQFKAFVSRIHKLSIDCHFVMSCAQAVGDAMTCNQPDCNGREYTDEIVKNVMLNGIYDSEIRQQVLAETDVHRKSNAMITLWVEQHKRACSAVSVVASNMQSGPDPYFVGP